jgi:hypothetical protein
MGHPAARLWLTWVAAQAVGGLVGFADGGLAMLGGLAALGLLDVSNARPARDIVLVLACACLWPPIAGAVVGLAEWLVLRDWLGGVALRRWLWTHAVLWLVGAMAGGLTVYLGGFLLPVWSSGLSAIVLAGLLMGLPVAIGEWSVFDGRSPRAWIWLLAAPLGYAAGVLAGAAAAGAVLSGVRASDLTATLLLAPGAAGVAGGAVSGLVSGAALAWMLRDVRPADLPRQ